MMPYIPPMLPMLSSPYYSRRNRTKTLEAMREQSEKYADQQLNNLCRSQNILEVIEKSELPEGLRAAVKAQVEASMPPPGPDAPPVPTLEQLKRQEIDQAAERWSGVHFELEENGGFLCWDFRAMLERSKGLEYHPAYSRQTFTGEEEAIEAVVFIDYGTGDMDELRGGAAIAFLRYLRFIGIMEMVEARRKCPDCGDLPPRDCDTCGGLGWVV
jgi:hypothetical protein